MIFMVHDRDNGLLIRNDILNMFLVCVFKIFVYYVG